MSRLILVCCLLAPALSAPELRVIRGVGDFFNGAAKAITKEFADAKHEVEVPIVSAASSQCSNVKKLFGVTYEELIKSEKEPDLNALSIKYITNEFTISYNITKAARSIPESQGYNPHQNLYIFIHGFTDNPTKTSFSNISNALFSQGHCNVLALDASPLIHWLYLRSTSYVRFIGEKLGEVLASMVKSGVDPAQIHIIGHSLGAHISGFTGKTFTAHTGKKVGRISGLDPAGPCFTKVDDDLRLKSTDASFVDVIHTDNGVYGLDEDVGQVDYFPNEGAKQPSCVSQSCSHSRAWLLYSESIMNRQAFPSVKCASWDDFKARKCNGISYMGFASKPGTKGRYYLQTNGESPFSLGMNGTVYHNDQGLVENITQVLG